MVGVVVKNFVPPGLVLEGAWDVDDVLNIYSQHG
jgi:hypothetical protein